MQIFDTENECFATITDNQREALGINDLARDYCALNYLSQEEATSFLKCKDKDRSDMVQDLLDTTLFDSPMDKIKTINKKIDQLIKTRENEQKQLNDDIKQLKQSSSISENITHYISLSNNQSPWDIENPQLNDDDFESWVKENGIIDNLKYYIAHETDFKQYNRNNAIADLKKDGVLNDVVFYLQNKEKESLITSYNLLQTTLFEPINNLSSTSISTLNIDIQTFPSDVVSIETSQQMTEKIKQYINMLQSSNNIQRMVQDLLETRKVLATKLQESNSTLALAKCPLCGTEFSSTDKLGETIQQYEIELNENFASLNKGLGEQFTQLKSALLDKIVEPIQNFFALHYVSEQIANKFKALDLTSIATRLRNLDKLGVVIDISKTESDCVAEIVAKITSMVNVIDDNVNFSLLNQMFNSYVNKDIDKENFTIENLEKKRSYLISQWNKTRSTLLSKKEQDLQHVSNSIDKLKEQKKSLKRLFDSIKQQKNQYVTKIISDIQILFYIYSGRILQDNYFGRGLFIKPDFDRNRILFVSGKYQNNDVDALYHMSSGQLVAVAVSFMLALNRLYSTNNLLAIDDPIQTIDDINFWGLMETLRHEFKDHFMLLSTHESNYEQLLDYKFHKIGIQSELINTADLHKSN